MVGIFRKCIAIFSAISFSALGINPYGQGRADQEMRETQHGKEQIFFDIILRSTVILIDEDGRKVNLTIYFTTIL